MFFVYMTVNMTNGKKYIGKRSGSVDDEYLGSGKLLKRAIAKYGPENFQRFILAVAANKVDLDLLEKLYIERFDAVRDSSFYNLAEGGTGGNTLLGLTLEELRLRSDKYRQYLSGMSEAERNELSSSRSRWMSDIRKDQVAEGNRLAKLKATWESKTTERKKAEYASRSGAAAYQARPVMTPLGVFTTAKAAAASHGITPATVSNRCNNANFLEWRFADARHEQVHNGSVAVVQVAI